MTDASNSSASSARAIRVSISKNHQEEVAMSSTHAVPAITYQRSQLQAELLDHLRDFTTIVRSIEVRQVMGKEAINELPRFEKQVRQHLEEPFQLVVLGDFK